MDLRSHTRYVRAFHDSGNSWPVWTADGKRVTFTSNQGGHQNLFWKPVDGSGPEERLTTSNNGRSARSWSSDGQLLVFGDGDGISVLSNQPGRPTTKVAAPVGVSGARLSPDGHWLAYVVKEAVRFEVYVDRFRAPAVESRFPLKAARSQSGIPTGKNCSTARATRWWPWISQPNRLSSRRSRGRFSNQPSY